MIVDWKLSSVSPRGLAADVEVLNVNLIHKILGIH